jgi:uncharacterized protein YdiU (UPF0061 family)
MLPQEKQDQMPIFAFDNTYATLPDRLFTRMQATPVAAPSWLAVNDALAQRLGSSGDALRAHLPVFAGNAVPEGGAPLAQLYAGHQFGGWSPQLGDGRALMLGEIVTPDGARFDLQLKGSGPTPYSRSGDGRSALGPVVREFLVSEAMAALGVPTTRALAAVRTGEEVLRQEGWMPGGILTRVAASHIRVGTFQVLASRSDIDGLQALLAHTLARHAPDRHGPLGLLDHAMEAQARLIARWMGLGFVHGVMNTDNMTLSGETIDYGPCAFMEGYDPAQVFSSIDAQGRYAYRNQPDIGLWNLAQLATALIPLMGPDRDAAIATLTQALNGFAGLYAAAWETELAAKIGLGREHAGHGAALLDLMAAGGSDFTNTFRALVHGSARDQIADRTAYDAWHTTWRALGPDDALMARTNPAVIPRNHRVQQAIAAAEAGDDAPFHALWSLLRDPYSETGANAPYRRPATPEQAVTRTFCGT